MGGGSEALAQTEKLQTPYLEKKEWGLCESVSI